MSSFRSSQLFSIIVTVGVESNAICMNRRNIELCVNLNQSRQCLPKSIMCKANCILLVYITAIVMGVKSDSATALYEIQDLENTTFFVETIGQAIMASDIWTIVSVITINDELNMDKYISEEIEILENLCDVMVEQNDDFKKFRNRCNKTKSERVINREFPTKVAMQVKNLGIISKDEIDVKWLFGGLDEHDMQKLLGGMKMTEDITFDMLHKRLTVTSSTMSDMHATLNKMYDSSLAMTRKYNDLLTEYLNSGSTTSEVDRSFDELLSDIDNNIEKVRDILSGVFAVVEAAADRKKNHEIINLKWLQDNYREIIRGRSYVDLSDYLVHMMDVEGMRVDETVFIKMTIPLASSTVYQLKKVYPIPHKVNEHISQVVIPRLYYYADSIDGDLCIEWSKQKLDECKLLSLGESNNQWVCELTGNHVLYTAENCFDGSVTEESGNERLHDVQSVITPELLLMETEQVNRWIFVTNSTIRFTVRCPDGILKNVKLNGTGILILKNKCEAFGKNIEIAFQNKHSAEIPTERVQLNDVFSIDDNHWTGNAEAAGESINPYVEVDNLEKFLHDRVDDLMKLKKEWKLEEMFRHGMQLSENDSFHMRYFIGTAGVVLLVIVSLLWKFGMLTCVMKCIWNSCCLRKEREREDVEVNHFRKTIGRKNLHSNSTGLGRNQRMKHGVNV